MRPLGFFNMDNLERTHKIFRDEVTSAAGSFFVWKGFNNVASSDKEIYGSINENRLSWNIITHSLLSTFYITLGRLFDVGSDAFSVHSLLRSCIRNIDQFSLDQIRQRKIRSNDGITSEWLDQYMKEAYEPVKSDFERLKKEVSKQQKIYEKIYRPIRHQVIAHKVTGSIENVGELFGKTNIGEVQELINSLHQIENIIFDLLYNGRLNKIGHYEFTEDERAYSDVEALLGKLKA
jgi:hypothetical protein